MKRDGEYYGLPTAVRSLALFYNKKLFQEAGLDPAKPPQTARRTARDAAKKTTKRDGAGNMLSAGITLDFPGQDHQWWREVLVRQNGGVPYSDDDTQGRLRQRGRRQGAELVHRPADAVHKVGQAGFMDEGPGGVPRRPRRHDHRRHLPPRRLRHDQGLRMGRRRAAGQRRRHAVATTPATGPTPSPPRPTGEKLEAAKKFLAFVTSPEAMQLWLETVGELPAGARPPPKPRRT